MSGPSAERGDLVCSAEGCDKGAVETLFLRDQVGHVHDCAEDAAVLREWCDVVLSHPIVDGECMAAVCTYNDWIAFGQPTALAEPECLHHWVDRPESAAHECLTCGEERHG